MIQAGLSFVLGFLSAAFLALLVAPAIWRRAVVLTRRRVEASLPLTMEQITAEKDGLRAEFAMTARALEMKLKAQKDKAAAQAVEIGRIREDLAGAREDGTAKDRAIAALEARIGAMQAEIEAKEGEARLLAEQGLELEKLAAERARELAALGRMYDEASFAASSRQIEMVAQEAKLEKLAADAAVLRGERKEATARAREAGVESKALREALRAETRKVAALEKKIEGLIASQSQAEERLERRERDLERLREKMKAEPVAAAGVDQARLMERLDVLTRENRKLREGHGGKRQAGGGTDAEGVALLRRQIADLAAEVVHLTARLDEDGSALREVLAAAPSGGTGGPSLAERIRALQEASPR